MSLKQTGELRRYTNKDGVERIRDLVIKDVRFNYVYLEAPRPSAHEGGNGTYEAQLIIESNEVWELIQEYFYEVYNDAVQGTWKGRKPAIASMNTPFSAPTLDDEGNVRLFEENAIVNLKTRTGQQPKLFLRLPGQDLREADEHDQDEFYSGMIGEAVVSFWAYPKGGAILKDGIKPFIPKDGIKSFINAVCKTDNGEPVFRNDHNYNYFEAFGGSGENEDTNVTAFSAPKVELAKLGQRPALKKEPLLPKKEEAPVKGNVLNNLLAPQKTAEKIEVEEEAPTNKTTLDDLLKRAG